MKFGENRIFLNPYGREDYTRVKKFVEIVLRSIVAGTSVLTL